MNKSKKSIFNMIFGLANQLIVLIVGLILPRLFIMEFGSEINGLQSSISYVYTYIALLEAGIGTATIQALFGPLARENRDEISEILSATNRQYKKVGTIYFTCMVIFAVAYPLTITTTVDRLTVSLMVFLSGVSSLMSFLFYGKFVLLLQADGCSFVVMIVSLVNYILTHAIKIIFILKGYSIVSIYVASAFVPLVILILYELYRRKNYAWVNYKAKPNMKAISQSKNVLVHQISNIVCNSTDVMVLTYVVRDLKLVSIYNLYTMIFDAVKTVIINIFSSVNFIMGQTYNSDVEKYREYHKIYELADFTVSFILYSVAYIMILPFMSIYTKGITDINYVDPKLPILFVLIKLMMSVREPAAQVINYAGHFKKTQTRSIIEAGINLAVSVVCAYKLGIYGVLIGTVVALLYRTIDMYLYTSKRFLDRSVWYSVKQWVIYMAAFAGVVFINSHITLNITGYVSFFINAIVVGLCLLVYYCAVTFIFNYKTVIKWMKIFVNYLKRRRGA